MSQQTTFLPCSRIIQGRNPRTYFDPEEMAGLEMTVRAQGVFSPILVRPVSNDMFELVAGERRWRAAIKVFGPEYKIPVLIKEMSDQEADAAALTENNQRANMSPTEEAVQAAKLLARCNGDRAETARILGWKPPFLDSRLALMNCSELVQKALNERRIKLGVGELLAAIPKENQDKVLTSLLALPEIPSTEELKKMLNGVALSLDSAIFDKNDCDGCQYNSTTQKALFTESIGGGSCTNGTCFNRKTEEVLNAKAEELKDSYPVVRIVRLGENFTLLKLKAEGETGVGEEQAKACRACQKFGAAISGIPGKTGKIYQDLCYDAECNSKKVAERIKAENEAKAAAAKTPAAKAPKSSSKGAESAACTAPAKPAVKVDIQDSNRVKEYRVKIWRRTLCAVLQQSPEKNLIALIALGMTGNGGKIDSSKMREAFKKTTSLQVDSTNVGKAASTLETASGDVLTVMHKGLAATAAAGIEETQVVSLLNWLKVSLADHWKLNEEYLNLLTKSEMEFVADEIGLKEAAGKDFQKLMAGKKDEIVKGLLKVEGYDYTGKVPKQMKWA